MFEFSKKTNLIERRVREYILNDVPSPELYREFFSYDGIPKVAFNHRLVPINMPDEIWITDTLKKGYCAMFEFSKKTNLIERRVREYILNDIPSPELYREFFSYDGIPKVAFNHRLVPINMPDEIWITDTTFRDGQQSITPYTTDQIERIFDYIHRLSGPKGIIRQSEFFLYSQKDRDAVCRGRRALFVKASFSCTPKKTATPYAAALKRAMSSPRSQAG